MYTSQHFRQTVAFLLAASLLLQAGIVGSAVADHEDDEDEDDSNPIIRIDIGAIVDAVEDLEDEFQEFFGEWDDTLEEVLIAVLFHPFRFLAQQLVTVVALVLLNTPDVYPNPAVEQVHRQVLLVTYLLSTLGFAAAGWLYMIGPVLGVQYRQVRKILPRMMLALVFASVSPILLQYSVDLSDALLKVFAPSGLKASVTEMAGLSTTLALVWVIETPILLVVVVMFLLRDVYLLFVAAISPLIALAWSLPRSKRYADTFIAGWWTALAMGPLDALVLKFNLALMSGAGSNLLQSLSNWIFGVTGFILMIWIPYQLYGASQAAVGQAYLLAGAIQKGVKKQRSKQNRTQAHDQPRNRRSRGSRGRFSRGGRR